MTVMTAPARYSPTTSVPTSARTASASTPSRRCRAASITHQQAGTIPTSVSAAHTPWAAVWKPARYNAPPTASSVTATTKSVASTWPCTREPTVFTRTVPGRPRPSRTASCSPRSRWQARPSVRPRRRRQIAPSRPDGGASSSAQSASLRRRVCLASPPTVQSTRHDRRFHRGQGPPTPLPGQQSPTTR